jgi:type IV secretory pathway VirB2 component (pilin)
MKIYLLNRHLGSLASLHASQDASPQGNPPPGDNTGKPLTKVKAWLSYWCAPIIVVLAIITMGFALAAILLGDN